MLDVLSNEEHLQRLRVDRKATLRLIQYFNTRPEKKLLHATAGRLLLEKREALSKSYCNTAERVLRRFDRLRICVLTEQHKDAFPFYDQFMAEIAEKGHDHVGSYHRRYQRLDMFKIIFKVLKVHESMTAPATEKEKKGEKTKDGEEGKAGKKK